MTSSFKLSLNITIYQSICRPLFFIQFSTQKTCPVGLFLRIRKFCSGMPPDWEHFIYRSCSKLITRVYNMDECKSCRKTEFDAMFLKLRWELKNLAKVEAQAGCARHFLQYLEHTPEMTEDKSVNCIKCVSVWFISPV